MTVAPDIRTASIAGLRRLFGSLDAPPADMLSGFYRAEFIGPWCLRATARPGVALLGLPAWQGKRFLSPRQATNLVGHPPDTKEYLQMRCDIHASKLDQQPCAALTYGRQAPRPWRWVTDELRRLDDGRLLGMTHISHPFLRAPAMPFLLVRAA